MRRTPIALIGATLLVLGVPGEARADHTCTDPNHLPPVYQCSHAEPEASFSASPYPARTGEPVTFESTSKANPDTEMETECWSLDFDRYDYETCGHSAQHTWDLPGSYEVGLKVTDANGETDVIERRVEVTGPSTRPVPPKPTLSIGVNRDEVFSGDWVVIGGRLDNASGPSAGVQLWVDVQPLSAPVPDHTTRTLTVANGSWGLRVKVLANSWITVRADLPGADPVVARTFVYAEWVATFGWRIRNRHTIESGFVAYGWNPGLDGLNAYLYYAPKGKKRGRLVARTRIFRTRFKNRPAAFARFRVRRAGRSDVLGLCIPEPRSDGFGKRRRSYRRCPRSMILRD